MDEKRPRTSLAGLFIATTALCAVFAFWAISPDGGEWNALVTAVASALIGGLLTPYGVKCGMAIGSAVIVVIFLAILTERDPSGLGPTEIVIPIQLIVAAIPMAAAAWLGRALRARLSPPR